ncbi:23S rRNA (guanine745-N1)-methyltransferase [Thermocatellispora tengchongensis]|uniref:23S rRNA (Guanine745-N1)-methyltransferase n=1 Tax=Thermocatellispora tengchongensis TaxID=1073253 RepID=A0A840P0H5_9ACTN|nr:methyltransferase domain-containing protein [Thermocatellispora tengchongensis]MBB5130950.1 23S rRNA (guanine745-N1)-methyltransferase [Thermocatellispora tengchongensis]
MLDDVVDLLACPVCGGALTPGAGALRCGAGHAFDVARQGYVSLLAGAGSPGTADSPAMVAARDAFLRAGHYAPLADTLARTVRAALPPGGAVLDAGAGTGYYLARALPAEARGIALDVSKHAVKRAARAHPRVGAVVADIWRPLPVADAAVDVVLNVFAPRNGPEFARVLRPGGVLVVVTPEPDHLRPLVGMLGLLSVDEDKERRVERSLSGGGFAETDRRVVRFGLDLGPEAIEAVVAMGPSAWHADPAALRERIGALATPLAVTAAFRMSTFEPAR